MFIWLHRILMMTVVVIAIFFVVSSMTFSGRFAEGVSDPIRMRCKIVTSCSRLWFKNVEVSVVAAGRLAYPPLPRRLHCNRLHVASFTKQQKIGSLSHPSYICTYLHCHYASDVRRARTRRRRCRGL